MMSCSCTRDKKQPSLSAELPLFLIYSMGFSGLYFSCNYLVYDDLDMALYD